MYVFVYFYKLKNRIFWNSKFHLPILNDLKKLARKGKFLLFVRLAQISTRIFYTSADVKKHRKFVFGYPIFNLDSRKSNICKKATKKQHLSVTQRGALCGYVLL